MTDSLEAAYRAHADELVRYATALVGPDRAQDVVTDALLTVFERHDPTQVAQLRAYLYRAVYHRAVDDNRSRDRRRRREDRDARERATHLRAVSSEANVSVDARRMLAELSDQQRAVVFLTYWGDHAPADIAEMLDVSEGTVRKQLARARARLREVLDV